MNIAQKILLVDDEPDILEFLTYNLKKEGYIVETACNGLDAIKKALEFAPDLILIDVMMPEMDGIEACREIRSIDSLKNVIIAFLTARGEDYSHIAGYDAGADDYIVKPIKVKVLISKLKALLRRKEQSIETNTIETGKLLIDREKYKVTFEGNELFFPRKEFELLAYLASVPGKVFNRDDILSKIWGDDVIVGDRTIDVHIRKIREKIGNDRIVTIKGVGYKLQE